jgi:hypothetical protein
MCKLLQSLTHTHCKNRIFHILFSLIFNLKTDNAIVQIFLSSQHVPCCSFLTSLFLCYANNLFRNSSIAMMAQKNMTQMRIYFLTQQVYFIVHKSNTTLYPPRPPSGAGVRRTYIFNELVTDSAQNSFKVLLFNI